MNIINICLFLLTTSSMENQLTATISDTRITTKLGDVIGKKVQLNGKTVLQFLKIPYAQPPIGNLRFRKPVPAAKWREPLNATSYGPSCPQNHLADNLRFLRDKNVDTSEDCLHLNIYIPETVRSSRIDKLPVLVWIHGGSFKWGQGMRNDGSRLALGGNVIVVTVNYRLGVLGFLSTSFNTHLRGNYGLWDVHMSLKWIKSNIDSFGGNPLQVAIFGESAGGKIVSCLVISPVNKGLFRRAIIMSGPLYSPSTPSNSTRIRNFSEQFINSSNCTGENNSIEFTMECLRKLKVKTIVDGVDKIIVSDTFEVRTSTLGPVIDFDFIPNSVDKLLRNKSSEAYKWFTSLDIIIGDTDAEGSLIYFDLAGFQDKFNFNITVGIPRRVLCDYVIPAVVRDFFCNIRKISEEMCDLYSTNVDISYKQSMMAIDMYTDLMYWAPTLKLINVHRASTEPAFMYLFSHQVEYGLTPYRTDTRMPWIRGANHADDVYILFGPEYVYPKDAEIGEIDKKLSSAMMKYWANFAKYGNPNGDPKNPSCLVNWPEYDQEEKYLNINSTISVQKSIFPKRMNFWLKRIPEIMKEVTSEANITGGLLDVNICATTIFMIIYFGDYL